MLGVIKTKLVVKAALLASAPLAGALGFATFPARAPDQFPTVTVEQGVFDYREAGDFAKDGRPVNAPMVRKEMGSAIVVMKRQVSAAEYGRCVADGACAARADKDPGREDVPVTGVSWQDATAYASWVSAKTGQQWRLPTDAEWAWFAGTRFKDDAVTSDDGTDGFTKRWLAKYDEESYRRPTTDKRPRTMGAFGDNERGITDLSGNVWEWTDTCFIRQSLGADGRPGQARTVNCGVRVVEGEHRSYVTDFIRDARAGGCAVGIPPANLGFRLVRDDKPTLQRIVDRIRGKLARPA